ncbi:MULTISPECIES: TraB/GumN family protein [unclassified Undibacterium]|uniref:TraB/GumN family protein n=2 Tax=Undibacterium TaxID=401469 RepID=UPI002AC9A512|nr:MULTISPECIES: TraB/GumN family protein [unclassified Undibacterium]MEB0138831.1 TraB/GumN family protein [Undibacterium sp. CCC2.1]MEB0172307.1 TraB/GumN family protein [Undibacterium sp. CCC1.1]MEB0176076.1 TraB/GumN family protein [Undibacterium sp. CCC3.4]MEB0216930.1 TraB/GumN family protein [Undibacterium sp. 5I2]WPX44781.1 TraB/GumN family protein [Undibacterium sp. CCC3.4]
MKRGFCVLLLVWVQPLWAAAPVSGGLWEVRQGAHTAYLFGSIHVARADFYPLPLAVQQVYRQADTLAVEVDPSRPGEMQKALPLLTYAAPDRLQNHLRTSTWEQLLLRQPQAATQWQQLRPSLVASALLVAALTPLGYTAEFGIDQHFITRAKGDHKTVLELESMVFQAGILGGLSDEVGDAMLAQTLDSITDGTLKSDTARLVQAWKAGDAATLEQLFLAEANKDAAAKLFMQTLLDDRNPAMVTQILAQMAAGRRLLVVVGAAHISGPRSLVDLLRKRGLKVRQISSSNKSGYVYVD